MEKTEELEFKSRLLGRKPKEVQAGDILGFAGKEIWDFLTSPSTDTERQAEVRKRVCVRIAATCRKHCRTGTL